MTNTSTSKDQTIHLQGQKHAITKGQGTKHAVHELVQLVNKHTTQNINIQCEYCEIICCHGGSITEYCNNK